MLELKEIIIRDNDIPEALKKRFKEVEVYSAPLPEKIYAFFHVLEESSTLIVCVSPYLTYTGIIAYLGTYERGETIELSNKSAFRDGKPIPSIHMF